MGCNLSCYFPELVVEDILLHCDRRQTAIAAFAGRLSCEIGGKYDECENIPCFDQSDQFYPGIIFVQIRRFQMSLICRFFGNLRLRRIGILRKPLFI